MTFRRRQTANPPLTDSDWQAVLTHLNAAIERLKTATDELRKAAAATLKDGQDVGDETLHRDLELLAEEGLDLSQQSTGLKLRAEAERSTTSG